MPLSADWNAKTKKQRQQELAKAKQATAFEDVPDFIELVTADAEEGVCASQGPHFQYAIFGRDSVEVAEDLLTTHQQLAYDIIIKLASLQGVRHNKQSEEEPGKIHHEYRYLFFDGHRIPDSSEKVLRLLQNKWGAEGKDTMVYYGSADATPLFVRLLGRYIDYYGPAVLEHTYTGRDGRLHTIMHSLKSAIAWIANKIEGSGWDLLEYKRINPEGIANQSWKDSDTAFMHSDGSLVNFDDGVAAIELQGYAYDALMVGARLLDNATIRRRYFEMAINLQKQIIERFWVAKNNFFAQGLDRDPKGITRQIDTLTSNPALLLDSKILHDMPWSHTEAYVEPLLSMIFSPDFLTPAGIRCRAWQHRQMPGYADYHGSYSVWPKETFDVAKGLHTFGYHDLARNLEKRIVNTIIESGEFYEFFYVGKEAKVWHTPPSAMQGLKRSHVPDRTPEEHPATPEPGQAWTISAFLGSLENLRRKTVSCKLDSFEAKTLKMTTAPLR